MSFRSRARFGLSLALAAAVLSLSALPAQTVKSDAGKADAAKKDKANDGEFRRISFRSSDGVELEGRFYPATGGAKDACVLMLHNFSHKTGGDSRSDEGWGRLAVALQKEGFPVLTFDFRGFGSSKSVDKALFWDRKNPHNTRLRGAAKMPETIDQKDFYPGYYLNLVNDVAAAKAYLDRRNDAREVNDSNLIVIGAGEGATVGALWLASECRRQKDKNSAAGVVGIGRPDLDQPECKDVTCAVWLSISPTVGGQPIPVKNWLVEAGRDHKIPMGFIYGKDDSKSLNLAQAAVSAIKPTAGPKSLTPMTGTTPAATPPRRRSPTPSWSAASSCRSPSARRS